MEKKLFVLISILLLCVSIANGQERVLRVDCDEWPPYQLEQGGVITGYSAEVVREVFKAMDQPIEFNLFPWKRALMRIRSGDSDAFFSVGLAEERELFAYYPEEPVFETDWVLWARKKAGLKFDSWDDLEGKRLGLVRGYSYTKEFWREIKARTIYEEALSDEINFKKLQLGRVDYIVAESGNGYYLHKKLGLKDIIPLRIKSIKNDKLYILFNKNNVTEEFVYRFSEELKRIKTTSSYQAIRDRYLRP